MIAVLGSVTQRQHGVVVGHRAALLEGEAEDLELLARPAHPDAHDEPPARQRVERGDPGCSIGAVFECAALVGVRLFDADQAAISGAIETNARTLTLLPKSVRAARIEAKDDF